MSSFGNSDHTCPAASTNGYSGPASPIVGSLTFQHLILIISGACSLITLILSLWLILKHLSRYTNPYAQRQIIRIIFTPVVFTFFSLLSIASYPAAQYLEPVRDLYEAFAIVSLWSLFVSYVVPVTTDNLPVRLAFFSHLTPPQDRKYKHKHRIIYAFLIVQTIVALAIDASEGTGTYCATSMNIHFAHIWTLILKNASLIFAVLSILRFYKAMKKDSTTRTTFLSHKPILKLISFKLIVLLNAVQGIIFSTLTGKGVLTGTTKVTYNDLSYGLPAFLVCIEQLFFAAFFHYSFRSRKYAESTYTGGHAAYNKHDSPESCSTTTLSLSHRMPMPQAAKNALSPMDYIHGFAECFRFSSSISASYQDESLPPTYDSRPDGLRRASIVNEDGAQRMNRLALQGVTRGYGSAAPLIHFLHGEDAGQDYGGGSMEASPHPVFGKEIAEPIVGGKVLIQGLAESRVG